MNNLLLDDKDYIAKVEEIIEQQKRQKYDTEVLTWEMIKMKT